MRFSKLRLAAIVSVLSLGGCADENESLIIVGSPQRQTGCAVPASGGPYASGGVFDVRFETAFDLPLEVQNQLISGNAASNSGTDSSELQLIGVDVTLFSDQRPDVIDRLGSENDAFLSFSPQIPTDSVPGGGSRSVIFEAVPAATAARLSAIRVAEATVAGDNAEATFMNENPGASEGEVAAARFAAETSVLRLRETFVVAATVRGRRTGNTGDELESRSYHYPIEVCHGCLVSCVDCALPVDDDADGTIDRTIMGVCPNALVPTDPKVRTDIGNFRGRDFQCSTAQDDVSFPPMARAGDA